jgi:hypothetical protein
MIGQTLTDPPEGRSKTVSSSFGGGNFLKKIDVSLRLPRG